VHKSSDVGGDICILNDGNRFCCQTLRLLWRRQMWSYQQLEFHLWETKAAGESSTPTIVASFTNTAVIVIFAHVRQRIFINPNKISRKRNCQCSIYC